MRAQLRKLGLPGVASDLPLTQARIVWNPQGYGAPDIPANSARPTTPGRVRRRRGERHLPPVDRSGLGRERGAVPRVPAQALRDRGWGLWGMDDPAYVERMAAFARTHSRMEFLSYFNSKPGSLWDLGNKPRSRAAYRKLITPLAG